jgi:hypothetical protein
MCLRAGITRLVLLVVVSALYCAGVLPQRSYVELLPTRAQSHSGASVALSDFDSDGLTDHARLGVADLHQSVEIYLSRAGTFSTLSFGVTTSEPGSLLAHDIDRDRDIDLIWTDLWPPRQVIVWLGDGLGRFECLCPPEEAQQRSPPAGLRVSVPQSQYQDSFLPPHLQPPPSLQPVLARSDVFRLWPNLGNQGLEPGWVLSAGPPRRLSNRGPPRFLC